MVEVKRSWRQRQLELAPLFEEWLGAGRAVEDFATIQASLTQYLIQILDTPAAATDFVAGTPAIFNNCNDLSTYAEWMGVHAYMHAHFLTRYWRTFGVLQDVFRIGHLPIRKAGIRVLDIGSGPAQATYAAQDLYRRVGEFSASVQADDLVMPPPKTDLVEQSMAWERLVHFFSEHTSRAGPYGARFPDFSLLDLQKMRQREERAAREAEEWDWEDPYAPFPFTPQDHKYDLYILSNYLTETSQVDAIADKIEKLFWWLSPGQSVLILGGSGQLYPEIYRRVEQIARRARVTRIDALPQRQVFREPELILPLLCTHFATVAAHLQKFNISAAIPAVALTRQHLWDPSVAVPKPRAISALLFRRIVRRRRRRQPA